MRSFINRFANSPIYSFTHQCIHSIMHSSIHAFIQLAFHCVIHSPIPAIMQSLIISSHKDCTMTNRVGLAIDRPIGLETGYQFHRVSYPPLFSYPSLLTPSKSLGLVTVQNRANYGSCFLAFQLLPFGSIITRRRSYDRVQFRTVRLKSIWIGSVPYP